MLLIREVLELSWRQLKMSEDGKREEESRLF